MAAHENDSADIRHRAAQHYDPSDSLPMIGKSPFYSHMYVATGFTGDGLIFGTLAGNMISDMIAGRTSVYSDIFKPGRLHLKAAADFAKLNIHNAQMFVKDRMAQGKPSSDLAPGEATVRRHRLSPRAYYRSEIGEICARSAVCSHLQCVVHFNNAEKSWDCPCHGSRYTTNGEIIEGPTLSELEEASED